MAGKHRREESSYPARTRTWNNRTKTCCVTITLPGKSAESLFDDRVSDKTSGTVPAVRNPLTPPELFEPNDIGSAIVIVEDFEKIPALPRLAPRAPLAQTDAVSMSATGENERLLIAVPDREIRTRQRRREPPTQFAG